VAAWAVMEPDPELEVAVLVFGLGRQWDRGQQVVDEAIDQVVMGEEVEAIVLLDLEERGAASLAFSRTQSVVEVLKK
jgi:hypothetical protein